MREFQSGGRRDVVVVTGAGGMGPAVARRLGSGRTLIIADASARQLDALVDALCAEGYAAQGVLTDVSDRQSVGRLAATASGEGRLAAVVHTAGVSAGTAAAERKLSEGSRPEGSRKDTHVHPSHPVRRHARAPEGARLRPGRPARPLPGRARDRRIRPDGNRQYQRVTGEFGSRD